MSEIIKTNTEYSKWIKEVSLRFRNSQIKAATKLIEKCCYFTGLSGMIYQRITMKSNTENLFSKILVLICRMHYLM